MKTLYEGANMDEKKKDIQKEKVEKQKERYEKPEVKREGDLKDITAQGPARSGT